MWTAAHGHILTLDNLMLCDRILVNCCCMCCCNGESVDFLLISCPIAHFLWMYMLRLFGIDWVMLDSVADFFFVVVGIIGLGNIVLIFGIWFRVV